MIVDQLTQQLFFNFPIQVRRLRYDIYEVEKFNDYLMRSDGIEDCYVSVYGFKKIADKRVWSVNKIFMDFDGGSKALEDSQKVYNWLIERGFTIIPVASGKKGIHLYILLKEIETTKQQLTNATWGILKAVFGLDYVKTTADPACIGDLARMCRIPNTRRLETNKFCSVLPHTYLNNNESKLNSPISIYNTDIERYDVDFSKFKWIDVLNWTNKPHEYKGVSGVDKTILDLPSVEMDEVFNARREIIPEFYENNLAPKVGQIAIATNNGQDNSLLKQILKPCLFNDITKPNPSNVGRVATTIELLQFFNYEQVADFYSVLGWIDWDRKMTVEKILTTTHLKCYSCQKLRSLGLCIYSDTTKCEWGK